MRSLKGYTIKNTKHKFKSLLLLLGIMISTCLIMTLILYIGNMHNSAKQHIGECYGNFHVEVVETNRDVYNNLKKHIFVKDINLINLREYDYTTTANKKEKMRIAFHNDKTSNLYDVTLVKGRFPKNNKEIIISNRYGLFGDEINIGETLDLYSNEKKEEFTIVGIYTEAFRDYLYVELETDFSEYRALSYENTKEISDKYIMYIKFRDLFNFDEISFLEKKGVNTANLYENYELMQLNEFEMLLLYADGFEIMIIQLAALLIILIVGMSLLKVVLWGEINNKTKYIGELVSNTSTAKELKQIIMNESMRASIIGVPTGILGAICINSIIYTLFAETLRLAFYCSEKPKSVVSFWFLIVGLILVFIVISVVVLLQTRKFIKLNYANANKEKSSKKKSNRIKVSYITKKVLGIKRLIGIKHFKLCKNKYNSMIISLTVIVIVLNCAVGAIQLFNKSNDLFSSDLNYDVLIEESCWTDEDKEIDNKFQKDFIKKFDSVLESLKNSDFDCNIYGGMFGERKTVIIQNNELTDEYNKAYANEYSEGKETKNYINTLVTIYVDDEYYKKIIESNDLNADKYIGVDNPPAIILNKETIYSMDYDIETKDQTVDKFKPSVNKLTIVDDDYYIDYMAKNNMYCHWVDVANEKLVVKVDGPDGTEEQDDIKTTYVEVGDYIDSTEIVYMSLVDDGIYAIYPKSSSKNISDYSILINFKDYNKDVDKYTKWEESNITDEMLVSDEAYSKKLQANKYYLAKIMLGLFVLIVIIVAMINILYTVVSNASLRKRDYILLKSIGMKESKIKKLIIYEVISYSLKAFVIGNIISTIIGIIINIAIWYMNINLLFGICISAIFIIIFIISSVYYNLKKIFV